MSLALLGIDFDTPATAENRVVVTGPADSGLVKQSTVTFVSNGLSMTGPCTIGLGTQTFNAAQRSEVLAVASDLATLDGEVTTLDGTVTTLSGDLTTLDGTVTTLSSDFTAFETDVNNRLPDGTDNFLAVFDGSGLKVRNELELTGVGELTFAYPSPGASDYSSLRLRTDRAATAGTVLGRVEARADDDGGTDTSWGRVDFAGTWPGGSGLTEAGALQFYVRDNDADFKAFELIGGAYIGGSPFAGTHMAYMYLPLQFSGSGAEYQVPSNTAAFAHSASSAGLYFITSPFTGYDFRNGSGTTFFSLSLSTSRVKLDLADLEFADAKNVVLGTTTGTKIGTATTQKLGFFNATPIVRPTAIASPAANVTALKTAVDAIRTRLTSLGLTA